MKESNKTISSKKFGELTKEAKYLLGQYKLSLSKINEEKSPPYIKAEDILGPVAFFYERIRVALDYKGDNLLRRNAIERIVRRLIWERPGEDTRRLALNLIKELTWAKYLKDNSFPEAKVDLIEKVLNRYFQVTHFASDYSENRSSEVKTKEWFLQTASSEIEEIIHPDLYFDYCITNAMFSWFKQEFVWMDTDLTKVEKDIQIYIAVQRSLLKTDNPTIQFRVLRIFYPEWRNLKNVDEKVYKRVMKERDRIEEYLSYPLQAKLYRFVGRHQAAFRILREVIERDINGSDEILASPKKLESTITRVADNRYREIKKRVRRGIVRSIIYIFFSKMVLAMLIEIPYELFIAKKIGYIPLALNIIFPPALMFFVGLTIKNPNIKNTENILERVYDFLYIENDTKKVNFSLKKYRASGLSTVFMYIYSLLTILVTVGIIYVLYKFGFNIISGGIFFMYLSLVLLFAYRVGFTALELNVFEEKESFFGHVVSNITLPFLNFGSWLSMGLAKFSFLVIILDFLIEAPLKSIIKIIQEWAAYIREKREEVINVPL